MINGAAINSHAINGASASINELAIDSLDLADVVSETVVSFAFNPVVLEDLNITKSLTSTEYILVREVLIHLATGVAGPLEVVVDDTTIVHTTLENRLITLLEGFTLTHTTFTDVIFAIVENMAASDTATSSATVINIVSSDIVMDDLLKVILSGIISENIEVVHTEVISGMFLSGIVDIINTSDSLSNKLTALNTLALTLTVADAVIHGASGSISENIEVTHVTLELLSGFAEIIEALTVTLTGTNSLLFISEVDDDFTLDDINLTTTTLVETLLEGLDMITLSQDGDVYSGWVMNPETFAIWNYDNYNFNSMATINRKTFLANSTGLYSMEGSLDGTAFIESKLKTAALDFGTSNLKKVPDMYIGASTDGDIVVKVSTDERVEVTYRLNSPTIVSDLQTIKLGKGLIGSLWQFEVIDVGATELDLTSIEWIPTVFGRKRR